MRINTETSVGIFVLGALALFFYMTFHIGVFRLDTANYRKQFVYFTDVSGLAKKADVKIAGVKVGWVEDIDLSLSDDSTGYQAKAEVMVLKKYQLRADAYAIVPPAFVISDWRGQSAAGNTGQPCAISMRWANARARC